MKNLLVIVALFIVVSNSSAQDLETIMKQGNEFYQSKQYNEAITSFESILKHKSIGRTRRIGR